MATDWRVVPDWLRFPVASCLCGFLIGIGCLALPDGYPLTSLSGSTALCILLPMAGLCGLVCCSARHRLGICLLLATTAAGYAYGNWRIGQALDARVPACADREYRHFELLIVGDPLLLPAVPGNDKDRIFIARFRALVDVPGIEDCSVTASHQVLLSWYDPPTLASGQRWQVNGKLRPPWGYRNPGGFDYERWLLGSGLHGTGTVRSGQLLNTRAAADSPVSSLRGRLKAWIASQNVRHGALVLALMMGDDSGISSEQWELLRLSGTVHLLVVSGLHVGLVAGFIFLAGRWLIRIWPALLLWVGASRLASGLAIAGSGLYVVLSGSGVPAVRAWLMSSAVLVAVSAGRAISPWLSLGGIVLLVVVVDPLVVHQQGFWMSFTAVFMLIGFLSPRCYGVEPTALLETPTRTLFLRSLKVLRQFALVQIVLLVALGPLLALSQGAIPLHSPLANGLAVPLVTVIVLPLTLLTGVLALWAPVLANPLLLLADNVLEWLLQVIGYAAALSSTPADVSSLSDVFLLTLALFVMGTAPGRRLLVIGALVWAVVLLPERTMLQPGTFRLTAVDVGQGSAILIDTRHHRLLYDAGPAYPSGFDLGSAAVVPSVLKSRPGRLDGLILSHDDLDHTGGAETVMRSLRPERIWSSFDPGADSGLVKRCKADMSWTWDGVTFRFLHPGPKPLGTDNDRSCVLLIESGEVRALLAGDVSRRVERRLPALSIDLLFAPHHGSRTSSSARFVQTLEPSVVFICAARRSRYGHPHSEVLARYRKVTEQIFVTGWHGALVWESVRPGQVRRWRQDEGAYWHGKDWSESTLF